MVGTGANGRAQQPTSVHVRTRAYTRLTSDFQWSRCSSSCRHVCVVCFCSFSLVLDRLVAGWCCVSGAELSDNSH